MSQILIIDDDPQLGRSLGRVFARDGHVCTLMTDLSQAVDAAASMRPDAIAIELRSDQSGEVRRLRQTFGDVPVLFMCGHRELFATLGTLVGPHDDWLAKPADPEEIRVRLETMRRRSARPMSDCGS